MRAATTTSIFSEAQVRAMDRLGINPDERDEIADVYREVRRLYPNKGDRAVRDGIFNRLLEGSGDPATFAAINRILEDHETALQRHERTTAALNHAVKSRHNPGAIDVMKFAEQERADIIAAGEVGVASAPGSRSVMKDGFGPGISRSAIDRIKDEYVPYEDGREVTGNLKRAIEYAAQETKKELELSAVRVKRFVETGDDLSEEEVEKSRAKNSSSRLTRAFVDNVGKAASGLYDAANYFGHGIISKSEARDDNWYRKKFIPSRNEAVLKMLSKLRNGPSDYAAIEKSVNDAFERGGDILDQESFEEMQKLISDELIRTGEVNEKKMQELNERLAELNKALLENLEKEGGPLADEDARMKYRIIQLAFMVTPLGALGAFNYLSELTNIFGPLFSSGAFSEGFAQFIRNLPFGLGDIAEFLRIDDLFEWALDNVPVVEQVGDVVDALTDNDIFQGVMQTAAPMGASPLTELAIGGVAALFFAGSEIELSQKRDKFNEKHEKDLEKIMDSFESDVTAAEKGNIDKYAAQKIKVLRQAEGRAQAADFVFTVKSLGAPAGVADGYNKRVMDLIFNGIATDPSKTGGVRRTVWDVVGDDAINDPEKVAKAFREVPDVGFRVEVRRRFLRYKGIEDDLRNQGYEGDELRAKALEKMCIISAACKPNVTEDRNYDTMMVAQNVMEIAERRDSVPAAILRKPGIFGSEYVDAVNHINNTPVIGFGLRGDLAALPHLDAARVDVLFDRIAVMAELRDSNAKAYNGIVKAYNDSVAAGENFDFDQALLKQGVVSNPLEVRKIAEKRRETERRRGKGHVFARVNREFGALRGGIDDFQIDDIDSLQKEIVEVSLAKREARGQELVERELIARIGERKYGLAPCAESALDKRDAGRETAKVRNAAAESIAKLSLRPARGPANYRIFGDCFADSLENISGPAFAPPLPARGKITYANLANSMAATGLSRRDMGVLCKRALIISGLYHNNRAAYDEMIRLSQAAAVGAFDFDAALRGCNITGRMADDIAKQEEKDLVDLDRLNRDRLEGDRARGIVTNPALLKKREDLAEERAQNEKRKADHHGGQDDKSGRAWGAVESIRVAMAKSLSDRSAGQIGLPPGPDPIPVDATHVAAVPVAVRA